MLSLFTLAFGRNLTRAARDWFFREPLPGTQCASEYPSELLPTYAALTLDRPTATRARVNETGGVATQATAMAVSAAIATQTPLDLRIPMRSSSRPSSPAASTGA